MHTKGRRNGFPQPQHPELGQRHPPRQAARNLRCQRSLPTPPAREEDQTQVPAAATTFWITALFGLFGLMPLMMHSAEARRARESNTSHYTAALIGGLMVCVIAFVQPGMML